MKHLDGWVFKRDLRIADLPLRPHQPLGHRRRRLQKRPRNVGGLETEHRLQHERCVDAGVDLWMGADKQQREYATTTKP
jgi:hypothetical protein